MTEKYHKTGNKNKFLRSRKRKCYQIPAVVLVLGMLLSAGCREKQDSLEKIKDLEYTVTAQENIPEELLEVIEEKKTEGFKLTYQDGGFLYICIGYGEQECGGYSIAVNELYETENAVYLDTTLLGPKPGETDDKRVSPSYPYVVVKTEQVDKPVVFE